MPVRVILPKQDFFDCVGLLRIRFYIYDEQQCLTFKLEVGWGGVNGWRWAEEIHLGENWRLGDCTQANFSVSRITENFTQPATELNGMCAFDILKMLQYCPSVSEPKH